MSKVLTVDKPLWRFVKRTMFKYARQFNLPLRKVKPLPPHKDWYGDCSNDGRVRVQLRWDRGVARSMAGPLLAYQIIDTMAHELAHLRHNNTHHPKWFSLHVRLLSAMERDGVYKRLRKLHHDRR